MFYSEYRPQKFSQLIGAEHIVASITGALAKGSPAHSYFFTGSRGTGKTTTARLLAKVLNCSNPLVNVSLKESPDYVHIEPCGGCDHCIAVQNGNHLDLIEIDAASNRGIDNIRDLQEGIGLSPSMGANKIYIIDEVHMLTKEASNALLKTLEEPPSHAYFILCTTDPEKVLDTIKSRCQQFLFKRPGVGDLTAKLKHIAEDKGHELEDGVYNKIATAAKGAYREAETLLEQIINSQVEVDQLLQGSSKNHALFIKTILSGDAANSMKIVHEAYDSGLNVEVWSEKLVEYLRNIILFKIGVLPGHDDFIDDDIELAKSMRLKDMKKMVDVFTAALERFRVTTIPTLPLEMAVIEIIGDTIKSESAGNPGGKAPDSSTSKPSPDSTKDSGEKSSDSKVAEKKESNDIPDKPLAVNVDMEFPYINLIEKIKPENHSIHLLLHSCDVVGFDGRNLNLRAYYSFHKERLMTNRIKNIVEDVASGLIGSQVVLACELSDKKPDAKKLTDKNIVAQNDKSLGNTPSKGSDVPGDSQVTDVDAIFEKVFGDDLEEA